MRSKLSWCWHDQPFQSGLRQLYADLLQARRQWPSLKDFATRSARLWPDDHHATVLELIRGQSNPPSANVSHATAVQSTPSEANNFIACYFNLTDRPQPLPEQYKRCHDCGPLFRSEQRRYGCEVEARSPAWELQLRPYECLVFGPVGWNSFVE